MHQLFLDANSYLGFYSLSPGDITELRKVVDLVKLKELHLLLPSQTVAEVKRNRARVVQERLKALEDSRIQITVPKLAEGSDAANALKAATAEAQKAHTALLKELRTGAAANSLPADELIEALFGVATTLADASAYGAASQRKDLGNPPGKGSSLGDGVNWELLLRQAPHAEDLCFVSGDGDFASPLDSAAFNDFLSDEWWHAKSSSIHYYRDIKQFLDDKFPAIRLVSDVRKYLLIDGLVGSVSFQISHNVIQELLGYPSFSLDEAERLLAGGLENSQVRWIAKDDDMATLLSRVLEPHRSALPKDLVTRWDYVIAGKTYSYGPAPTMASILAEEAEAVQL